MNRLTVLCKSCGSNVLTLDALPAVIQLVVELVVRLAQQTHGAFHQPGSHIEFEIKIEPILIEKAIIQTPNMKGN